MLTFRQGEVARKDGREALKHFPAGARGCFSCRLTNKATGDHGAGKPPLGRQRPGYPQPDVAVAVCRPIPESLGRAQHAKGLVPRTAAHYAAPALIRFVGAAVDWRAG